MLRLRIKKIINTIVRKRKEKYLDGLRKKGLKLGDNVDIVGNYFFDPSHCFLITIGRNSTICPNVRLIAHDASTKKLLGYTKIGKIVIGKNCFIGDSTIILPNVEIGANTIIGAGSVVTQNLPAEVVAAGNPAKVICNISDYKDKYETLGKRRKIFNEEYLINNLNQDKRNEIINEINKDIGFII